MGQRTSHLKPQDIAQLHAETCYTEEEIRKFHEEFLKEYPSGLIKKKDIHRIYAKVYPNGDPSMLADQFFRMYDIDNSGLVDFREFLSAASVMAKGDDEERLRLAFKLYDQDHNDYISRQEYHNIVTALYKAVGTLYDNEDHAEEAFLFEQLDKNCDDKITFDEFVTCARRDPTVRRLMNFRD